MIVTSRKIGILKPLKEINPVGRGVGFQVWLSDKNRQPIPETTQPAIVIESTKDAWI